MSIFVFCLFQQLASLAIVYEVISSNSKVEVRSVIHRAFFTTNFVQLIFYVLFVLFVSRISRIRMCFRAYLRYKSSSISKSNRVLRLLRL